MHVRMCVIKSVDDGKAKLLNRDGLGVKTLAKGAALLGTRSQLISVSETRHDGQEGDIVTVGKTKVLILGNSDLDDAFKKFPQSQAAIARNAMQVPP